jgi:hypothetical protein
MSLSELVVSPEVSVAGAATNFLAPLLLTCNGRKRAFLFRTVDAPLGENETHYC